MKNSFLSAPAIVCIFTALVLGVLTLGPFMHETDQAWLLDGGRAIAQGHPEIAMGEFNYDKQFISYWIAAALAIFFPRPTPVDAFVTAGNILNMVLFWGALAWLLARSARRLPLALVLPVILAPTFLVHSPFFASAFTSAALVFLLAIFLARRRWNWVLHLVVFALAFLAVGARADAMFLLPLLAMLHSPQRTFASVLKSPNTWLLAAGGLLAVVLGRLWYLDTAIDFAPHPFKLKQYLGFAAFGLGAAGLVLLAGLHAVWSVRRLGRCRWWIFFTGLGLAMPMGYYSLQLLTPRHCTVGVLSVVVFICARRGRILFANYFRPRPFARGVKFALILAAVLPLFVGVNLAELRQPRLTLSQPTLLPSGAGVCPTGAYLAHAWHVRREAGFIDHNHAIWAAAKTTKFQPDETGRVPYAFAPVESYLIFAIRLQDLQPSRYSLADGQCPAAFYVESRSLMRFQYTWPPARVDREKFLARTTFTPVAEQNWHGITLLRAQTNGVGVDLYSAGLLALNQAFGPDEFHMEPASSLDHIPAAWRGRKLVIAGGDDLQVIGLAAAPRQVDQALAGITRSFTILTPVPGESLRVQTAAPEKVFVGVSWFPEWMSLQKL